MRRLQAAPCHFYPFLGVVGVNPWYREHRQSPHYPALRVVRLVFLKSDPTLSVRLFPLSVLANAWPLWLPLWLEHDFFGVCSFPVPWIFSLPIPQGPCIAVQQGPFQTCRKLFPSMLPLCFPVVESPTQQSMETQKLVAFEGHSWYGGGGRSISFHTWGHG